MSHLIAFKEKVDLAENSRRPGRSVPMWLADFFIIAEKCSLFTSLLLLPVPFSSVGFVPRRYP